MPMLEVLKTKNMTIYSYMFTNHGVTLQRKSPLNDAVARLAVDLKLVEFVEYNARNNLLISSSTK